MIVQSIFVCIVFAFPLHPTRMERISSKHDTFLNDKASQIILQQKTYNSWFIKKTLTWGME